MELVTMWLNQLKKPTKQVQFTLRLVIILQISITHASLNTAIYISNANIACQSKQTKNNQRTDKILKVKISTKTAKVKLCKKNPKQHNSEDVSPDTFQLALAPCQPNVYPEIIHFSQEIVNKNKNKK